MLYNKNMEKFDENGNLVAESIENEETQEDAKSDLGEFQDQGDVKNEPTFSENDNNITAETQENANLGEEDFISEADNEPQNTLAIEKEDSPVIEKEETLEKDQDDKPTFIDMVAEETLDNAQDEEIEEVETEKEEAAEIEQPQESAPQIKLEADKENVSQEKAKKLSKRKAIKTTLKVFKILGIIIFFPIVIAYLIIKKVVDNNQKKKWENEGKRGKELILSVNEESLPKLSYYEFRELIKSLFFYDGYRVETLNKNGSLLGLEKDGKTTYCILNSKKSPLFIFNKGKREIEEQKENYDNILVVSLYGFMEETKQYLQDLSYSFYEKEDILDLTLRVKDKVIKGLSDNDVESFKNIDISQRFPFMI